MSKAEFIFKLKELLDSGFIQQEEFEARVRQMEDPCFQGEKNSID
jgi:hypothetical protein